MELSLDSISAVGIDTAGIVSAELVEGRADLHSRAEDHCPVCGESGGICTGLLYLRTPSGTRGTGAHAGFLVRVHLACADWTPSDVRSAERVHDRAPTCGECLAAAGIAPRYLRKAPAGALCECCLEMFREAEESARRDAECAAELDAQRDALEGAQS